MRRCLLVVAALAGCRNVIGIPEETFVETFPVAITVLGATGATDRPIQVFLDGTGEERQVLTVQRDTAAGETLVFPRGLGNGAAFTITTTANCQGGAGTVTGAVTQPIVCDGVLGLADFGFSAPLATELVGTSYRTRGSLLTQSTTITPRGVYPMASTAIASRQGVPVGTAPIVLGASDEIDVKVSSTAFTLISERTHTTMLDLTGPPAQFGYGKAPAVASDAHFGAAIDSYGEFLVVGEPDRDNGHAVVYRRSGRTWTLEADFMGAAPGSRFGASVAIAGGYVVVGAPGADAHYLFRRDEAGWTNAGSATVAASQSYGTAVAIQKSDAPAWYAVGAPLAGSGGRVFARRIDGGTGATLDALTPDDELGASLAMSATGAILAGAPGEASLSTTSELYPDVGAAYHYASPTAAPVVHKATVTHAGDRFGAAVAIAEAILVVGAPLEDGGRGAVYVLGVGAAKRLVASMPDTGDGFGTCVAVRAGATPLVAVGAPFEDGSIPGVDGAIDELAPDAGGAYLFAVTTNDATPGPRLKASNPAEGDQFGAALALTSELLVVGAPYEDSAATAWNGDQGDGAIDGDNGAVYAFR